MNNLKIQARLENNEIPFRADLPEKLNIYFSLLKEWNKKMDLTAVTDDSEMLDKHFIDSLMVLKTGLILEPVQDFPGWYWPWPILTCLSLCLILSKRDFRFSKK